MYWLGLLRPSDVFETDGNMPCEMLKRTIYTIVVVLTTKQSVLTINSSILSPLSSSCFVKSRFERNSIDERAAIRRPRFRTNEKAIHDNTKYKIHNTK